MLIKIIPVAAMPAQTFIVALDGQRCSIRLRQMGRRIYLDLAVDSDIVCAGAICLNGPDIIQSPSPYFKGTLHFFDLVGEDAPQWEGLGSRYQLLYAPDGLKLPRKLLF